MPSPRTVAAVTGASSGVGRATAARFLARGWAVSLLARRGALLRELAEQCRPDGEGVLPQVGDVTDPEQVAAFIAETVRRFDRLDVLVINAGLNIRARALRDLAAADWRRLLSVNLDAAYHCTAAALPQMRAQGGGLLIYVASRSARHADRSGAGYQASKHGLVGLANAVRVEEQAHGIRATVIYPGVVNTPLVLQRPVPPTPEQLAAALQPEDVAAAIEFVALLPKRVLVTDLEMAPVEPM